MAQGKITETDTDHLAGYHSIRTNQRPTSIFPPPIFTPDALPAAMLPIYPGLGQAPNILTCIPSGVVPSGMNKHSFILWNVNNTALSLLCKVCSDCEKACLSLPVYFATTMASLDGVPPSQMVSVSASVNLPLHRKVQKFSSDTGSPGWSLVPQKGP